jgi:hypothetical protein
MEMNLVWQLIVDILVQFKDDVRVTREDVTAGHKKTKASINTSQEQKFRPT